MSRYPALQGKADMTGIIHLEDTLTHEALFHIDEAASFVEKVGYTTVNWAWINRCLRQLRGSNSQSHV